MSEPKIYRLFITPQTKVNIADNERWIPTKDDEYLLQCGIKKRQKQIDEGTLPEKAVKETWYITRKKYFIKYLDYKRKVKDLAMKAGLLVFPTNHVWFRFYVPMPKSWTKKKRKMLAFEAHQSTPDASNLHKALEDSFSKGDQDKVNWDYRATKFWYEGSEGFIEIELGTLPKAIGYRKVIRESYLE